MTWLSTRKQLPDADTTVLVHCPREDDPVWLGYYGDGEWFSVEGVPLKVTHWQHLPEPPAKEGKSK